VTPRVLCGADVADENDANPDHDDGDQGHCPTPLPPQSGQAIIEVPPALGFIDRRMVDRMDDDDDDHRENGAVEQDWISCVS
jgi:hypothetical protein